jgi:hypothetical protein
MPHELPIRLFWKHTSDSRGLDTIDPQKTAPTGLRDNGMHPTPYFELEREIGFGTYDVIARVFHPLFVAPDVRLRTLIRADLGRQEIRG